MNYFGRKKRKRQQQQKERKKRFFTIAEIFPKNALRSVAIGRSMYHLSARETLAIGGMKPSHTDTT